MLAARLDRFADDEALKSTLKHQWHCWMILYTPRSRYYDCRYAVLGVSAALISRHQWGFIVKIDRTSSGLLIVCSRSAAAGTSCRTLKAFLCIIYLIVEEFDADLIICSSVRPNVGDIPEMLSSDGVTRFPTDISETTGNEVNKIKLNWKLNVQST